VSRKDVDVITLARLFITQHSGPNSENNQMGAGFQERKDMIVFAFSKDNFS
jgi:hypothetical protein